MYDQLSLPLKRFLRWAYLRIVPAGASSRSSPLRMRSPCSHRHSVWYECSVFCPPPCHACDLGTWCAVPS
jgi:hypothetical protein